MTRPGSAALMTAAVIAFGACAEDSGPATVRIFGLDPDTKAYGFFAARLETLHDVTEMRGDAVVFRGNATIVGDAVAAANDASPTEILRAEGGEAPACSFSEVDGVLHPDDYDSLVMASSYWSLEQSRALFLELGVDASELNPVTAYYHPRIQLMTKLIPTFWMLTDNAAYAPGFDGFLVVPHLAVDGAPPFSANLGVIAHEYAHKVFNVLVERGARVPAWQQRKWAVSAVNQFRGVDEGVADVFGYVATGDPDFIRPSMGGQADLIDRDMRKVRIMHTEDVDALLEEAVIDGAPNYAAYDPHVFGGFVAAAMFQIGEDLGDHRRVAAALLDVERELAAEIAADARFEFSAIDFFDRFAGRFERGDRTRVCSTLDERFRALLLADERHRLTRCS